MNPFKKLTARRIHLWIAIALVIPFIIMACSGILISMRTVTKIQVPMSWMGAESVPDRLPIMVYLEHSDGSVWIGNAKGLSQITKGQVKKIDEFSGQEVIGLAQFKNQAMPVVATRMAVWVMKGSEWTAVKRGRVRQLNNLPNGDVLAIAGGRGEFADGKPWVSQDGNEWNIYNKAIMLNKQLPALENPTVALHQFMREIHSGAFVLGKGIGEMIWSNVLGWVLLVLSLTGLWMWRRKERIKRNERLINTIK